MTTPGVVPADYTMPYRVGAIDQRTYSAVNMDRAFLICNRCGGLVLGAAVPLHNGWHSANPLMGQASTGLLTALRNLLGVLLS